MAFSDLLWQPNVLGKDDMYIPHSFTVHLAFAFFQRIDPFNLMIKHYQDIQEEMMSKQEERFAKEMEYLKKKLKENLHEDTKAMVKFMQDDNHTKEVEIINLKMDLKRLTLQHTLLTSDHELLKMKYSKTSENAPDSYEHLQHQVDDWHNKFNARDADVKLLTRQVENLKGVIMTQGLFQTVPPPEPVSAPAPSKAPEELPIPGQGWQFGGADRAANRPNWGTAPPPEPIHNNGWGISPSPAPQDSSHGYSDSSVEPQFRGSIGKGKQAGRGKNNYSKGQGNDYFSQSSGKRGRDSREDNARDVRQKSWNSDGKSIAESWSKSPHVRLY